MAMRQGRVIAQVGLLGLVALAAALSAWGAETSAMVGIGGEYTDNLRLTETNRRSEWVSLAMGTLRAREETGNFQGRVESRLEYRNYRSSYADEMLLFLDADADYRVIPGSLSIIARDYFSQAPVDLLAPPTPVNRQNANLFAVGPEYTIHLSPVHNLLLGARFSRFYFEKTNVDNTRVTGYGRWVYNASPRTTLSLNGEVMQVDYSDLLLSDYRRNDLYLRVVTGFSRSDLQLDLGNSVIRRDLYPDVDGRLGRLAWTFNLNSTSGVRLALMGEYTDTGHDLTNLAEQNLDAGLINEQVTGDLFYSRQADLSYFRRGRLVGVRLAAGWRDEDYEILPRDRSYREGQAEVEYQLSPLDAIFLKGHYRHFDYREEARDDRDSELTLGLNRRLSRHLFFTGEVARRARDSSLAGASFQERRLLLLLRYDDQPAEPERRERER